MKIAITSCSNSVCYPDQPVWGRIAARNPDVLVLLGDSVYYDVPWPQMRGDVMQPYDLDIPEFIKVRLSVFRDQALAPEQERVIDIAQWQ